jgi:hypothetical protein
MRMALTNRITLASIRSTRTTTPASSKTSIKYVVQVGDLDVAGDWQLQAYVEFPTWKGRGEVATLKVKNTI